MSRELALKFFKEATEYKLKGDYKTAKDRMTRAISYDPTIPEIHYENGKLNFLMENYITSINSYLAFTHLELMKRVRQLNGEEEFQNEEEIEKFYKSLPEETKDALPIKAASLILEDGDICNHIAHSYIGSHDVEDPELLLNFKIYYATLVGRVLLEMTIEQYKPDINKFHEMNNDIFIPQGRMLLLENINWEEIDNDDVLKLYFSN